VVLDVGLRKCGKGAAISGQADRETTAKPVLNGIMETDPMKKLLVALVALSVAVCSCGRPQEPAPPPSPIGSSVVKSPVTPGAKPPPQPSDMTAVEGAGKTITVPSTGTTTGSGMPPSIRVPGSAKKGPTTDQVVGVWKVDAAKTTIPVPTAQAKTEQASFRLELKKNSTYTLTGAGTESGSWRIGGETLYLTAKKDGPRPPFTISPDAKELSAQAENGKVMVLVKT